MFRATVMLAAAHASVLTPSAIGTTYRALVAGGVGDSFRSVAKVVELPIPALAEGEVLVKVVYAGVNGGCETFRARGEFAFVGNKDAADGFALGAEGVGVVAAIGDGVENVVVGDAVCFVVLLIPLCSGLQTVHLFRRLGEERGGWGGAPRWWWAAWVSFGMVVVDLFMLVFW